jgi:TPR repeat protein
MKIAQVVAGCMLFAVASLATAGNEEGLEALFQGDYATALAEFRPLAEQGYANSQYNLGVMYAEGKGVEQNFTEAAKWYRLAAEQGVRNAQFQLARSYNEGLGVPQNFIEAYAWFSVSDAYGYAPADGMPEKAAERLTPEQLEKGQALAKQYFEKYQPKP